MRKILFIFFTILISTCFYEETISYRLDSSTPQQDEVTESDDVKYVPTSNVGYEFKFVFPPNLTQNGQKYINIASTKNTDYKLFLPNGSVDNGSIAPYEVKRIDFASTLEVSTGKETGTVIKLEADNPIIAYAIHQHRVGGSSTDAYTLIPTRNLGTGYVISSYEPCVNSPQSSSCVHIPSSFTVISPDKTSNITIQYPDNTSESISLNDNESYTVESLSDLSGTFVQSDQKIAVFSGSKCINIPIDYLACDMIYEQMLPISSWKKEFLTYPISTRTNGDTIRIYSSENDTTVSLNNQIIDSDLDIGEFWQTNNQSSAALITSDKPIMTVQYSNSATYDSTNSDPFMMVIPGVDQYLDEYIFSTPPTGFSVHYVNIIHPQTNLSTLKLDNTSISSSFSNIPNSTYAGASIQISAGSHVIKSDNKFGIFVYGFYTNEGYGYPGGFDLE